jgi:hypothetical protein
LGLSFYSTARSDVPAVSPDPAGFFITAPLRLIGSPDSPRPVAFFLNLLSRWVSLHQIGSHVLDQGIPLFLRFLRGRGVDFFCEGVVDSNQPVDFVLQLQNRFSIFEGFFRLFVGSERGHLLTDHNDREEDQLQERLGDPRYKRGGSSAYSGWKTYKCYDGEQVCAPHRAHGARYEYRQTTIESDVLMSCEMRADFCSFRNAGIGDVVRCVCHAMYDFTYLL